MAKTPFQTLTQSGGTIKAWIEGVVFDPEAEAQLRRLCQLPFIYKWVAAMPDVHVGIGTTVGSVIPTEGAIIPAAVGVDIGCGMMAVKTSLKASDLPDSLSSLRSQIEKAIPVGNASHRAAPKVVKQVWKGLVKGYEAIIEEYPKVASPKRHLQLGTLGGGNHFIELCLDESDFVWIMLHSGSRGVGNLIGRFFIALAKKDMEAHYRQLPDKDLAYFTEGTKHFQKYMHAVEWAQNFARSNRHVMMEQVLAVLRGHKALPPFQVTEQGVNCHHNYVQRETHFGKRIYVTRKGAVSARAGELGIIPGSMGAKSFIVRGLGNPESFQSCSHGAGRTMSRTQAKQTISLEAHLRATEGVECRKDRSVLDESPAAYKDIDAVMYAQRDLVEIVATLKQVLCVKG